MNARAQTNTHSSLLYQASVVAIVLAFVLSAPTLNLFMHFTLAGGNALEKFHPYVYLLFGAYFVSVLSQNASPGRTPQLTAMSLFCAALFLLLFLNGRSGYATVVANNYWAPLILFGFVLTFSEEALEKISRLFLWLAAAQAMMVILEFFLGSTFLPVTQEFAYFRPAGVSGHPLNAGVIAVLGLLATRDFVKDYFVSRAMLLLLTTELLVLGVRGSLLFAALILVVELLKPKLSNRASRFRVLDLVFVGVIFVTLLIAMSIGALDRFAALGFWDGSAQSRFRVFDVLALLSDAEFRNGVPYDRVGLYLDHMRLNYIESPFIAHVIAGGIGFAIAAHAFLLMLIVYIGKHSKLLALAMLFYLVSSLTFSSKTPLMIFFVLLAAVNRARAVQSASEKKPSGCVSDEYS